MGLGISKPEPVRRRLPCALYMIQEDAVPSVGIRPYDAGRHRRIDFIGAIWLAHIKNDMVYLKVRRNLPESRSACAICMGYKVVAARKEH